MEAIFKIDNCLTFSDFYPRELIFARVEYITQYVCVGAAAAG